MWLAEQLNSLLTLGECKEYSIMARSKSIPGNKTTRGKNTQPVIGNELESSAVSAETVVTEPVLEATAEKAPPAGKLTSVRTTSESRRMEVVKNDSRKNLVPINLEDEIRRRAYELYQQRGDNSGSEADDWLNAEREVRQRYRQQSA
jgi:Protein of unknown function (DUF2934)